MCLPRSGAAVVPSFWLVDQATFNSLVDRVRVRRSSMMDCRSSDVGCSTSYWWWAALLQPVGFSRTKATAQTWAAAFLPAVTDCPKTVVIEWSGEQCLHYWPVPTVLICFSSTIAAINSEQEGVGARYLTAPRHITASRELASMILFFFFDDLVQAPSFVPYVCSAPNY